MDAEKLCLGCMKEKENTDSICLYCGFHAEQYAETRSPRVLPLGTILNGRYLLGKVIGEGGFGITYLAYDLNLQFPVAIKEYFPTGLATRDTTSTDVGTESISILPGEKKKYYEYGMKSFYEEAVNLAKFQNTTGVVSVKDYFRENGTAYLVMEYIAGKSLKHYLEEIGKPLSEEETLNLLRPILTALARVHEEGIIHRDISPENIMLADDGRVILIDFGAARISTGAETKSLTVLLKHGYAPVEQYQTKGKQGPWTDIYAICATMYRMMSGIKPEEAIDRMVNDKVVPLAKRGGISASGRVSAAIEKGLAVQGEKRYQTIEELMQNLYLIDDAPKKSPSSVDYEEQIVQTESREFQNREAVREYKKLVREAEKRERREKEKAVLFILVCTAGVLLILLMVSIVMSDGENNQNETSPSVTTNSSNISDVLSEEAIEAVEFDDAEETAEISDASEVTESHDAIEVTEYNNAEELVCAIENNFNIEFDKSDPDSWKYSAGEAENITIYPSGDGTLSKIVWQGLPYLSCNGIRIGTDRQEVMDNNTLEARNNTDEKAMTVTYRIPAVSEVSFVLIKYDYDNVDYFDYDNLGYFDYDNVDYSDYYNVDYLALYYR